jgi:hypothetical protein
MLEIGGRSGVEQYTITLTISGVLLILDEKHRRL